MDFLILCRNPIQLVLTLIFNASVKLKTMKKLFLLFTIASFVSSCTKFLDETPLDKLTPEQAFATENTLQLYVNSFNVRMLPTGPDIYKGDVMADITVPNVVPAFLTGSYTASNGSGWSWTELRNVNYFLENYQKANIPQASKNHFAGIARFYRAWFYFDMVKRFGDLPWCSRTLDVSDSALYLPQDSRGKVMDSVLADLNFACTNIYDVKDNSCTNITRSVALAFKSRVCLFEGSFRKYHSGSNLGTSSVNWFAEAADAAGKLIASGKYKLNANNTPDKDYRALFISENPVSTEILLASVYNNSLRKWHDATWWYNSATLGSRLSFSKSFINTYLNKDGSRFTDIPGYDTIQFQTEVKNRDLRLASSIRSGSYRRTNGTLAPPDFNVVYSGYQIQKFSLDDSYYDTRSEAYNSIPIIRYAEVLLNFAEAKEELGTLTAADWNISIGALRARAGITNTGMPVKADPYMISLYPNISSANLLEIRRERAIELAGEGFRFDDLRRWKAGKLLEKGYEGLYVPAKNQLLDLNEDGKFDVCFVDAIPSNRVSGVVYFVLNGSTTKLSGGTKGNLLWLNNTPKTFDDKRYLYPIPTSQIVANPNLKQNAGW